ncbi:MAG: hypothetical protein IJ394_09575 [Bacteroidales bacterium]|nr:hypothetical protein [Bacteroidales bacterium]
MENIENKTPVKTHKSIFRRLLNLILWTAGIWAAVLVILQFILSSSVLTGIVNRYAAEYVDGEVSFGDVSVNMFRRFPNISLSLDDVSITYPSDRFEALEQAGAQGDLLYHGTGAAADTLMSFERFSVSINLAALAGGSVNIPHMRLTKPRIFAHSYAPANRNWDIFRFATTEEEEDSTGTKRLPKIVLGRISLAGKPHVVYTDSRDTVFAMIDIGRAAFNGRLSTRNSQRNRIGLTLDNIFVAGRIAADTLAFRLDALHLHEHNDHIDIDASADAMLLTKNYGRTGIPVRITGTADMDRDSVPSMHVEGMRVSIAGIPIDVDMHLSLDEGRTGVEGFVEITDFRINDLIRNYAVKFVPELAKVGTDARLSLLAACQGDYIHSTGKLPSFSIVLSIPEAEIMHEDITAALNVGIEAEAYNDADDRITVDISRLTARTEGLVLEGRAGADDLLGSDPTFGIDASLSASLDTLVTFLPDTLGIEAAGSLTALVDGKIRMSQMDLYTFSMSELAGHILSDKLSISMPEDTVSATIDGIEIRIAPETMRSKIDTTASHRMIGISAKVAGADIAYKDAFSVKGEGLAMSAKNASGTVRRLGGRFSADNLIVKDSESMSIELDETSNGFQMIPKRDNEEVPLLTLTSVNKRIFLTSETNRAILTDSEIRAEAAMNSVERRKRREERLDSLAAIYPDTPRDSLMAKMRAERAGRMTPSWALEDDFSDRDIDLRLDETLAKYFREWDMDGHIDVRTGIVMTPYFPLRNILRGFHASFSNNEIVIDSMRVRSGKSEIGGKGSVTGLRRALGGRGRTAAPINIDIALFSDGMDAGELLTAYNSGMNFNPESLKGSGEMSDAEFLKQVTNEVAPDDTTTSLIVVPSNVNAKLTLDAGNIKYSDLEIDQLTAQMLAKDRCVQITGAKAVTNMGDISFDGFYATRSKEDIQAGFSFDFADITADKVISLMPAVDTLMPMLKSFNGLLNCELAATARLDTAMNIITPSIDGVLRIGGRDLAISGDASINKLAKILKFKNIDEARIDAMLVEGMIKDNTLEVFPFVLEIDRYTLALSGMQNLDMSFKYHISMIKSPMLFRFGVDLYGPDFDNMKFKVGKAKYKNVNVPAFSSEIDEVKINLAESIRRIFEKGVANAMAEHKEQDAIREYKKEIGYVEAIDMELEALGKMEKTLLETEE